MFTLHSLGSSTYIVRYRRKTFGQVSGINRKGRVLDIQQGACSAVAERELPNGVQMLAFFCSSVPVVLFDTPGISRGRSQQVVSVESTSLFHHSMYPWFICFPWWSVDKLDNLHADRANNYMFWAITEDEGEVGIRKTNLTAHPSILILTVPKRYFCCGSLPLLALAIRIYTLVLLLYEWHILVKLR